MKTILIPIDFSPASHAAADYAARLARQVGTEVLLLYAYTEPLPVAEAGVSLTSVGTSLREEIRLRMEAEKQRLRRHHGVVAKSKIVLGFAGDTIKEVATAGDASIICLGRKAGAYKVLWGSTITKAVRKTNVPVMVVPEGARYAPLRRIVLAVDFREMVHQPCVAPLLYLVKTTGAALTVLHIEKAGSEPAPGEVPEMLQVNRVLSRITYVYEKAADENVVESILKYTGTHATDMLVMIAHQHSFVSRLFGETHTRPVAWAIDLPVLILKNDPV